MLTITPSITSIEPRTSGGLGGHKVTVLGSGLEIPGGCSSSSSSNDGVDGNLDAAPSVAHAMLAGVPCTVTECSQTKLVCVVDAAPQVQGGSEANSSASTGLATSTGLTLKEWTGVSGALFDGDWDSSTTATPPDRVADEIGALSFDREPLCQAGLVQTKRDYSVYKYFPHGTCKRAHV